MDQEITPFLLGNLIHPFKESLMIIDSQGKILSITEHSKKVFREKQLIGNNFTNFIIEEENLFKLWLQNINGNKSDIFRFNIKRGNHFFPMMLNALSFIGSEGENLILLSMKDDSELQKTKRDILQKTLAIEHFSKSRKIRDGNLNEAIFEILEMSAKAMETKRVNVWRIDEKHDRINCIGNLDESTHIPFTQESLHRISMPEYFKLFENETIIVTNNAMENPITQELKENYLIPHNVHAMMDVPIRIEGDIIGVICFENVGHEKKWTLQDQKFGLIAAQMVSLAIETYERKKAQTRLEIALHELQSLFRESNHRIKNNLAIISSLIHLEAQNSKDEMQEDLFLNLQNRVLSIISLHDLLNKSRTFEKINFKEYMDDILNKLNDSFAHSHQNITVNKHIEEIEITASKAIPLGLIVNEIITNSYKHAFKAGHKGIIDIEILKRENQLLMMIKDNGIGFDFASKKETFGIEILKDLVNQLDGKLSFNALGGANFSIEAVL
jgi:two-component sensor histidine kinase